VKVVDASVVTDFLLGRSQALEALAGEAEVRRSAARRFLRGASAAARYYDLVFLDPPYGLAGRLGDELTAALPAVLAPGAVVVVESDRRAPLELGLPILDERRYGDTLIRIHGP
jgi:16S rRNA (guanine966-N2)-methyltransferase